MARLLAGGFRVIRIERRLYAANRQPKSPHSIQRETEDLEALFARVGEPVVLVGHSSGGVVAMQTALRIPAAIRGLVLYEPPVAVSQPLGGDALTRARAALARGDESGALMIHLREMVELPWGKVLLLRVLPTWKRLRRYARPQIADDEALESLGVGIERYTRLAMPVLLIGGTRSPRHLLARLEALARVIPRTQTAMLPGQGHSANLTAPDQVARLVGEFAAAAFGNAP